MVVKTGMSAPKKERPRRGQRRDPVEQHENSDEAPGDPKPKMAGDIALRNVLRELIDRGYLTEKEIKSLSPR